MHGPTVGKPQFPHFPPHLDLKPHHHHLFLSHVASLVGQIHKPVPISFFLGPFHGDATVDSNVLFVQLLRRLSPDLVRTRPSPRSDH